MKYMTTKLTFAQLFQRQTSCFLKMGLLLMILAPTSKAFGDNAREIIGKWELLEIRTVSRNRNLNLASDVSYKPKKGDNVVTEFLKDGTFTTSGGITGSFQFEKDSVLKQNSTVKGKTIVQEHEIRIVHDSMILERSETAGSGTVTKYESKYRRVK